ncbi:carboxymuconolactone decarboxylase family protein [Nonomuraea diastatica]|uniref:carboxymuconolactone decarboxylase family protein n=1 Tax=Nonomuraea diastatica TaxID=1848329 RepID=UPI003CCC71E5
MALRVSQINGCSVCVDMHTKEPRSRGNPRFASTWSRRGGRRRSSPRPSGPPWRWLITQQPAGDYKPGQHG